MNSATSRSIEARYYEILDNHGKRLLQRDSPSVRFGESRRLNEPDRIAIPIHNVVELGTIKMRQLESLFPHSDPEVKIYYNSDAPPELQLTLVELESYAIVRDANAQGNARHGGGGSCSIYAGFFLVLILALAVAYLSTIVRVEEVAQAVYPPQTVAEYYKRTFSEE